ncbi:MAG: SusD/RagB family nutrient-binding outer membrane lipoprotein [Candidatus Symbiothrix sp.]|jgi:hypothetical protein|nr:SusD/RagB family nutrient-binding outer membrane lipoprotein [Candidatus Symbiothrix sp.]
MKKIFYYIVFVITSLGYNSCSDLSDLNKDPKSYVTVKPEALFLSGQKSLADTYSSTSASVAPFRVLSQIWANNVYTDESRYLLSVKDSPGGWWKSIYTTSLVNLKHSKEVYTTSFINANVLKNNLAIIDIIEIYDYYLLVNTYGDIPYTEALKENNPFPKYDDAKTIILDLLNRLDTDIANLDPAYASLGNADQIYNGNVTRWKRFAATLKLKTALLLIDVEPELAKNKALEAVSSGVFESSDDDALFKYDGASVTNSNPVWQTIVQAASTGYSPTQFYISTLKSYNDPRLGLQFVKDIANDYSGGIPGQGNNFAELSPLSATWLKNTRPVNLLDYAEAEFLLAEAIERGIAVGGTAEGHYKNAIKASILSWGGNESDADTYLSEPAIQYSSANWKEKIGYQKWIAFADRNWDTWTEIRRLGYPNIDMVNPPVAANGKLPQRFYYPPVEQTSNPANWSDAVSKIPGGQDVVSAKLFWKL